MYTDLDIIWNFFTGKFTIICRYFVSETRFVNAGNLRTSIGSAKGTQGVLKGLV